MMTQPWILLLDHSLQVQSRKVNGQEDTKLGQFHVLFSCIA